MTLFAELKPADLLVREACDEPHDRACLLVLCVDPGVVRTTIKVLDLLRNTIYELGYPSNVMVDPTVRILSTS